MENLLMIGVILLTIIVILYITTDIINWEI